MTKAQKFVVAKKLDGELDDSFFNIVEEDLPALSDGGFIADAVFLSVEPYHRFIDTDVGNSPTGLQVARITYSKNDEYPKGVLVVGNFGWRTRTVVNDPSQYLPSQLYVLPDFDQVPISYAIGIFGVPGLTAYFGIIDVLNVQDGETVVITSAAGGVGHVAGQIAKIKGAKVIGFTGTDEKVEWLLSLGFDHAINYKTSIDIAADLKTAAPNGVDVYFDNVGGEISSTIMYQMNNKGRVGICGVISTYNNIQQLPKATLIQMAVIRCGFVIKPIYLTEFRDRNQEGIETLLQWVQKEKIKSRETVYVGFENMAKALVDLFKGENIGKSVVKIPSDVEEHSINFKNLLKTFKGLENNK